MGFIIGFITGASLGVLAERAGVIEWLLSQIPRKGDKL